MIQTVSVRFEYKIHDQACSLFILATIVVDNARFAGSDQLWQLCCAQIQVIDVFHHHGLTVLSILGQVMIHFKENMKCLAVEDCQTVLSC